MTSDEYLLASRSISWIPICISLVVSFVSSVGVMGITANMYVNDVTFGLRVLCLIFPLTLSAECFAPIFRRLKLISVNEVIISI